MDKKYQVFISSTYLDLKEEREKAVNAILKLEHIPIGMELFNAGDDTQWAIIERAINNTDYYILIVGFRYGSVTEDDISYTEKEYDYAVSHNVPVIAFIKDRSLPTTKEERESKAKYQKKLDEFISKVEKKECNYWKTSDELAAQITSSLVSQIKYKPRIGWIRADFDPIAISQEMAIMMKENRELRKKVEECTNKKPHLDIVIIDSNSNNRVTGLRYTYKSPEGNIHVLPLNIQDIIEEVKDDVTEANLQAYNDNLPSQKEIDNYNKLNSLYENANKNAHYFSLEIGNVGNCKANDIFIDLNFPDELFAYYDYDIEDIEKPKKLDLPENPIETAYRRKYSAFDISALSSILNPVWRMQRSSPAINADRLKPDYFKRDHIINADHKNVTIKISNIIHSRVYKSDKIWFIATKRGRYTIDCEVICDEYESPDKFSFEIIIE